MPMMCKFQLQSLEPRVLLSGGSSEPMAPLSAGTTPATVVTKNMRKALLGVWEGANKAQLQSLFDQNKMGAFDSNLLAYMQGRSSPKFYFDPADAGSYASYINTNLGTADFISGANNIVNHLLPDQSGGDYSIQLPAGDINWLSQPGITPSTPDFGRARADRKRDVPDGDEKPTRQLDRTEPAAGGRE
jgi:hypothetical protein